MVEAFAAPGAAQIARFRERFGGDVIEPGDERYDAARRIWNAAVDKRPALIVRPTSVPDVVAAIRFAREQGLPLVLRGGGHTATSSSTCDGGVVIDLGRLDSVSVDPTTRRATVAGGALLSALDKASQAHGLVCPIGVIGHTGVGGLTLGGGMGRLMRRFGLTIDNLRSVQMVTATGEIVRASETEHPELFWGIRGAGTQFGAVTQFDFELQPFAGTITRGVRFYDGRQAPDVWATFRRLLDGAPELGATFGLGRAVPEADYPEAIAGKPIAFIAFGHSGDPADVDRDTAAIGEGPEPAASVGGPASYLELQTMNDEAMGWGKRSFIDSVFLEDLPAAVLDRLVEHVTDAPGDASIGVSAFGGAIARVDDDATAFPSRTIPFDASVDGGSWDNAADDERYIAWTRAGMAILAEAAAPFGRYTNECSETGEAVSRSVYGEAKYARIAALKREWDPDNVFLGNHNVAPA
jgi:FAD/FMN-containing dehydrogenase